MADNLITCNHCKRDCFAWYYGQCRILTEQITEKECPFYKNMDQFIKEREESRIKDINYRIKMSEKGLL